MFEGFSFDFYIIFSIFQYFLVQFLAWSKENSRIKPSYSLYLVVLVVF